MNVIKTLLFITVLYIYSISYGQYFSETDNYFNKLTIEDGLSQNKANCFLRDKAGYMWIGTGNGLNRFDGRNIKVFEKDFDGDNLRNIEVFDLLEDKSGEIWIASQKGLFKYNPVKDEITRHIIGGSLKKSEILCLAVESDSLLWLGTTGGLKLFDKKRGIVLKEYGNIPYEPYTISSEHVLTVCCRNEEVWVGTTNGLNKLDKKTGLFKRYFHDINEPGSIGSNHILKIVEDTDGNLWIGSYGGGLGVYNESCDSYTNYNTENSEIQHNDVRDIFSMENDSMWIATDGGGLSLLNVKTREFSTLKSDPINENGLSNNAIYTVYQDYEGILWLGFYVGGVNFRTSTINEFKTVSRLPGNENSIVESHVRSLFLDTKGNLWIGTLGGLSFYNSLSKNYKSYSYNAEEPASLSFNTVTSIFEDSKSNMWIGTYSGGLNFLKKDGKGFKHYRHDERNSSSLSADNIYEILEDKQGRIWVATSNGLNYYNNKSDSWERVINFDIRNILELDDKLYLGITGGIIQFDPELGTYEKFSDENLDNSIFMELEKGQDGNIWFGTQGEGLGVYDIQENSFLLYTIKDGLPSNFIASIEKNGENQLWISTYSGLSLFDIQTKTFVNYGLAEGLPFLGFNPTSSTALPDGNLAFGGSDGIVVFNPNKITTGKLESKLMFNDFKIGGTSVAIAKNSPLSKNINLTSEIELKYSQNDFSFEFVDINYKSRGLGQFAYKLENYMEDWNSLGDQTSVGFTNMEPGKYVLKVRKLGGNIQKGYQDEIEMQITIVPPFWRTWYFYLFVGIVVIGLIFLYNKYTLTSISKQNELYLKNLDYEKNNEFNQLIIKFFTYISHELRTPLSLIVDPLHYLLKSNVGNENHKYLTLIENSSERLKRLVDQILDFRKLENDTLSLAVTKRNITTEVSKTYSDFTETATSENIIYRFDNKISDGFEGWIDTDKLEKILYNLLSNAFKFTKEKGEVTIALSAKENDTIEIIIRDNGYGIHPDELKNIFEYLYTDEKHARHYKGGIGIGLAYVKRLVDLHHGTISVDSKINKGTAFTIVLPISYEAYSTNEIGKIERDIQHPHFSISEDARNKKLDQTVPKHGKNTPLVLVVEDEKELRDYLVFKLTKKFRVISASNGKEALEKLSKTTPDLILCDNVMPVMDGVTFCDEVKSTDEYSHIPFLFLSAWNSEDFKLKGLMVGAEDYISKPFNYEIVEIKICNIIDKRKKLIEIAGKIVKVKPEMVKIETSDERFIMKAQEIIERNIENFDFTTQQFEEALSMSHSVVYRKIKSLTGLSANEFIREFKIRRAAQIIKQDRNLSILDVSLMVGFNDQKYFSRCFKNVIGVSPSEYALKGDNKT